MGLQAIDEGFGLCYLAKNTGSIERELGMTSKNDAAESQDSMSM